jgi:hypothetical protein
MCACAAQGGLLAFLVTSLGTIATAVVTSRSFFGEIGVIGPRLGVIRGEEGPLERRARSRATDGTHAECETDAPAINESQGRVPASPGAETWVG